MFSRKIFVVVPICIYGMIFSAVESTAQTKVFYPKAVTIDLSNPNISPPKELDKKAKKKWRELKRDRRKELKSLDKKFAKKFDSIQSAYQKKHLGRKYMSQVPDSAYAQKFWANTRDSVFSSYQNQYLGHDYLGLFFDSTYVQKLRADLKDSLMKEQMSFREKQLAVLKSKYNIPDSLTSLVSNPDSLGINDYKDSYNRYLPDSTLLADSVYGSYLQEIEALNDSLYNINYLSVTETILTEQLQNKLNQNLLSGFTGVPGQSGDLLASYEEIIQANQYKQLMADMPGKKLELEEKIKNPNLAAEELPKYEKHFLGKSKALTNARNELEVIKKKHTLRDYLKYLFDQDMESLEERTFVQRFNLSGYLQISGQDPLLMDYSPALAYNATGKLAVGVGVSGRLKIGQAPTTDEDLFAYRSFVEYTVVKKVYLHGEYERTGVLKTDPNTDISSRVWSRRWLLGLGRDFKHRSGIKGSLLILYNFNNSEEGPHGQTFQVRYGLKI